MRCRLSEVANFFTLRKGEAGYEPVGTNPPLSLAENVLAQTTGTCRRWPESPGRRSCATTERSARSPATIRSRGSSTARIRA